MSHAASQPNLRLVGTSDDGGVWSSDQRARLAVIKENRIAAHASGLDPGDPRLILANQTQSRLQGATLTPERREALLKSGKKLGLRPFESNLVIAIVQDRARSGLTLDQSAPPLALIGEGSKRGHRRTLNWPRWFAAIAAAFALAALAVRWLTG